MERMIPHSGEEEKQRWIGEEASESASLMAVCVHGCHQHKLNFLLDGNSTQRSSFGIHGIGASTKIGTTKMRREPRSIGLFWFFCGLISRGSNEVVSMRLVVQRVSSASVTVEGKVVSQIGPGTLALVGLHQDDSLADLEYCCKRLINCKLWENDNGGMWRHSIKQRNLECMLVSQFTLYGTLSKKHQPDYKLSMKADKARSLYEQFVTIVKEQYKPEKVQDGVFGAKMSVDLVNDGPVTIIIDSEPQKQPVEQVESES